MHNNHIMNRLSNDKRTQIVRMIVEGNSVRSITRMTGVCQEAILKLLCDLGTACAKHHKTFVRNLTFRGASSATKFGRSATRKTRTFQQSAKTSRVAFGRGSRLMLTPSSSSPTCAEAVTLAGPALLWRM